MANESTQLLFKGSEMKPEESFGKNMKVAVENFKTGLLIEECLSYLDWCREQLKDKTGDSYNPVKLEPNISYTEVHNRFSGKIDDVESDDEEIFYDALTLLPGSEEMSIPFESIKM